MMDAKEELKEEGFYEIDNIYEKIIEKGGIRKYL